jgi:hypothetical protein
MNLNTMWRGLANLMALSFDSRQDSPVPTEWELHAEEHEFVSRHQNAGRMLLMARDRQHVVRKFKYLGMTVAKILFLDKLRKAYIRAMLDTLQ